MSLKSLMLYGSHARGDQTPESDIDLLALSSDESSRLVVQGKSRFNIYRESELSAMAVDGALFVWHLAEEGIVLYDSESTLRRIFESFRLKSDYSGERDEAAAVGWVALSVGAEDADQEVQVSALVYSLRTIIYSLLAERKICAFAKSKACANFKDASLLRLWDIKRRAVVDDEDRDEFRNFLLRYSGPGPQWATRSLDEIAKHADELPRYARKKCLQLLASSEEECARRYPDEIDPEFS